MSRLTLRVTVIAPELALRLVEDLQAWLEERVPDGVVDVRRTVVSQTDRAARAD